MASRTCRTPKNLKNN